MMAIAILLSYIFKRNTQSLNVLLFVASVMIFLSPNVLFDVAFQLSFLAVLGLIALRYQSVRGFVDLRFSLANSALALIEKTAIVFLFTLPVLALYFNKISWIAFISNVVAIPMVSASVFLAFCALFTVKLGLLSMIFSTLAESILNLVVETVHYLSQLPFATIALKTPSMGHVFFYYGYLLLFVCGYLIFSKINHKVIRSYSMLGLFLTTIIFVFPMGVNKPSFNILSTPKNFICFLNFNASQRWMLEYKRGRSIAVRKKIIEPQFKAKKTKKMTGLLTSHHTAESFQEQDQFFDHVFSSTSGNIPKGQHPLTYQIKRGDWIELGDGTEIHSLFIRNNEVFWYVEHAGFSILVIPEFTRQFDLTDLPKADKHIDLLIFIPENISLTQHIQQLKATFKPRHMIVNHEPKDMETFTDDVLFLSKLGQINVVKRYKLWVYDFYRRIL
jgi:ComEC/Rec2-related protein